MTRQMAQGYWERLCWLPPADGSCWSCLPTSSRCLAFSTDQLRDAARARCNPLIRESPACITYVEGRSQLTVYPLTMAKKQTKPAAAAKPVGKAVKKAQQAEVKASKKKPVAKVSLQRCFRSPSTSLCTEHQHIGRHPGADMSLFG